MLRGKKNRGRKQLVGGLLENLKIGGWARRRKFAFVDGGSG